MASYILFNVTQSAKTRHNSELVNIQYKAYLILESHMWLSLLPKIGYHLIPYHIKNLKIFISSPYSFATCVCLQGIKI